MEDRDDGLLTAGDSPQVNHRLHVRRSSKAVPQQSTRHMNMSCVVTHDPTVMFRQLALQTRSMCTHMQQTDHIVSRTSGTPDAPRQHRPSWISLERQNVPMQTRQFSSLLKPLTLGHHCPHCCSLASWLPSTLQAQMRPVTRPWSGPPVPPLAPPSSVFPAPQPASCRKTPRTRETTSRCCCRSWTDRGC